MIIMKHKREEIFQKIFGQLSYLRDSLATDCPAFDADPFFFYIIFRDKNLVNSGGYRGFDPELLDQDVKKVKNAMPARIKKTMEKIMAEVQDSKTMSLSLNGTLLHPDKDTEDFAREKTYDLLALINEVFKWRSA
jgi:hypothetical protein